MKVPFFNYPALFEQHKVEYTRVINDVLARGAFILQDELKEFETNLAAYLDTSYVLGVGNCTDGLLLSFKAADIGYGDEVIFCSHTFVATASAIYQTGATPVPVECGPDHLIDIDSIESAITTKTKAIVPTQLNGQVCDMDSIMKICSKNSLILIEDSAQSLGAKYKGKSAGTFGIAGVFSFYPAKNLGCFGDGGSIVTNDEQLYDEILLTRNHGRSISSEVIKWGMNSRLDNLQAAILNFKLSKYSLEIERRREIASLYNIGLSQVSELILPSAPNSDLNKYEVFQNYEIEVKKPEDRESLRDYLKGKGIKTILQWGGKAVHEFEGLGFKVSLPFTEALMKRAFLLPMNTSLTNHQIEYIIIEINKYFGYAK